ncbi:ankyrin repeat domain-containing protein [Thermodesulfobacteriota bacterium]
MKSIVNSTGLKVLVVLAVFLAIAPAITEAEDKHGIRQRIRESIEKDALAKIKKWLAKDPDIDAKDKYGWTALMEAAGDGHRKVVELLIAHGADVSPRDNKGKTALDWALLRGSSPRFLELVGELAKNWGACNATKYGLKFLKKTFKSSEWVYSDKAEGELNKDGKRQTDCAYLKAESVDWKYSVPEWFLDYTHIDWSAYDPYFCKVEMGNVGSGKLR